MLVILEAVSGPIAGRKIDIKAGSVVRFGRTTKSDYAIGEDPYLSGAHFAVECDGREARVRDMGSSNGTFVNGERVTEIVVREGDSVAAGASTFTVHVEAPVTLDTGKMMTARTAITLPYSGAVRLDTTTIGAPLAIPGTWPGFSHPQSLLLTALYSEPDPVFAVLDASRDSRIPAFLDASGEQFSALVESSDTARSGAFLVLIPPKARLLDVLIKDGWGRGWGFYLTSRMPIDEIRAHLRAYLTVQTEYGRPLTFRFHDPRILRAFLPALSPQECSEFLAPFTRIIVEGEKPEMALEFRDIGRGARQHAIVLV